jgi:hypothetical protein
MGELVKGVFSGDIQTFENAQRTAKALSASDIVPEQYKNKPANCLIAIDMANNMGANVLTVMQNLDIIHGKPSWSSKFLISVIKQSPKFSKVEFVIVGDRGKMNRGCYVKAYDNELGKEIYGTVITMQMAKDEGWVDKRGSKWKTMPDLMLQYRAGAFFARIHAPEITMGLLSQDEAADIPATEEADAVVVDDINKATQTKPTPGAEVQDAEEVIE